MENKQKKIQSLVINHLREHGTLDLILPDGIAVEIGITHTNRKGDVVKTDDYCYVTASREDRKMLLDSYNLNLSFSEEDGNFVFEESGTDEEGNPIRHLEVI